MTDRSRDSTKELSGTLNARDIDRLAALMLDTATAENRLSRWRNYFFTPDVIAEICGELGVPFRTNGYRYWKPS
ncbi:MAG TPA: hypothetical protein VII08_06605 [Myxococcales bacterium]